MNKKTTLIIGILIGLITATTIGVTASVLYNASEIGFTPTNENWNVDNLEDALNDLYTANGSNNCAPKYCMFVASEYGNFNNHLSAGSKYICNPGDNIFRYFYVLEVNDNQVDLIMEENLTSDTMVWNDAVNYFNNNTNGKAIKEAWKNVQNVDIPSANVIANVSGTANWSSNSTTAFCIDTGNIIQGEECLNTPKTNLWLWDYTFGCSDRGCKHNLSSGPVGYWLKESASDDTRAWRTYKLGYVAVMDKTRAIHYGVRPVITLSTSNLQQ